MVQSYSGSMSKARSRLGRGLSSLIGSGETGTANPPRTAENATDEVVASGLAKANELFHVELSRIRVNPYQPRREFDPGSLEQLAVSLKSSGLIQPIIVREVDGGYELIAGERRYRAALIAGLPRLPAILRMADAVQQAEWALIENIHRQDLNPVDRAEAYHQLITEFGLTQESLAERLGEERSGIANHLRLLRLIPPVRGLVSEGRLTFGHAKILAGIDDPDRQQRLADMVLAQGLSVRALESLIQPVAIPVPSSPPASSPKAHLADIENRLTQRLQMRVQVKTGSTGKRGRVVIHYGSLDQFDQLMEQLGVVLESE
jgi:ParB family chromosome partitioning protein